MDSGRSGNYSRGGGRGYRPQGSGGRGSQGQPRPQAQRQWVEQPPQQGVGRGDRGGPAWTGGRPGGQPPTISPSPVGRSAGGGSAWTGRPWGQRPPLSSSPVQAPDLPSPPPPRLSSDELDIQSLKISPQQSLSPRSLPSEGEENRIQPMRRPDRGGQKSIRSIKLVVNHFPVNYDPRRTIYHYDVDVKPVTSDDNRRPVKKIVRKSDLRVIRNKLCSDRPDTFPIHQTAYDGEKNIFSAVVLPTGQYKVKLSDGENDKGRSYLFTIRFVNELKMCKLKEYLRGELSHIPRDVLQGMDLVMKENLARQRICVGKSFYSDYKDEDDLGNGVAIYRGSNQSLKPTSQGPILCVDYAVLAFRKPMAVTDFLRENVPQINSIDDIKRYRPQAIKALKGLKVRVTHRPCQQKFPIVGLAEKDTCQSSFDLVDREGINPPRRTSLVAYFQERWGKNIKNVNIPCLLLGRSNKSDEVPMEFCVLVEGQVYPKEDLDNSRAKYLKDRSIPRPADRSMAILEMLQANDGPCGGVVMSNFGIQVDKNMTKVVSRVIGAPELRIGGSQRVKVDGEKCQWNLTGDKRLVDGKTVVRWALIDFTDNERYNKLDKEMFIGSLKSRCGKLGIRMNDPLVCLLASMRRFSSAESLENLLKDVVDRAKIKSKESLQLIVCVMAKKDPGYKFLKWVSETKIGVLTQCCLSSHANKGQDQYLANLCLKINAKLGGSNFELMTRLPHFVGEDRVMFVGADVNHPGPGNAACPSIAAVVGTVNWPAANRYAARVSPQAHRQEKISNFGGLCLDLIKTYVGCNGVRPNKIVIFRDGVSDEQFGMVLEEELRDIKNTIYDDHYQPKITLIVAQKRHQTRLFGETRNDIGPTGNVPPGTVVDTVIIHPFHFDFYLCSHYGGLGTSKPTHYYVLLDENCFSSDELQKLIYDMCFTFARCTKPVSLVPPVYYADLVAYRGRLFQEAAMESQYCSSSSTSDAISTTSLSTTWFDKRDYDLHRELENIMFFV